MKDQFVTYEIAVKLKGLGFNEQCIMHYFIEDEDTNSQGYKKEIKLKTLVNSSGIENGIKPKCVEFNICAPLWQQVIDWLRNTKNIQVYVKSNTKNMAGDWIDWIYSVNLKTLDSRDGFDTYEEAREKGILKALELITK